MVFLFNLLYHFLLLFFWNYQPFFLVLGAIWLFAQWEVCSDEYFFLLSSNTKTRKKARKQRVKSEQAVRGLAANHSTIPVLRRSVDLLTAVVVMSIMSPSISFPPYGMNRDLEDILMNVTRWSHVVSMMKAMISLQSIVKSSPSRLRVSEVQIVWVRRTMNRISGL